MGREDERVSPMFAQEMNSCAARGQLTGSKSRQDRLSMDKWDKGGVVDMAGPLTRVLLKLKVRL